MLKLGIILTAATVTILVVEYFRVRRRAFPAHGWLGLFALAGAEYLMFHGVEPAATYFSPLAWTAYILIADAATFAISGRSRLREEPRGLLKMAILSIPLWLIFEAYNLKLANWMYVGLPQGHFERWLGFVWAFATITPGIFITAGLIESFGWFERESRSLRLGRAAETFSIALGAVLLIVPLAVPKRVGAYLFGLVWLGFLFLLDPVNYRLHLPSFEGDLARGRRGRLYSFLAAGWVCGWLWEFWNYWARARWIYTFPSFLPGGQQWKIFQMPAPGYLAFPVFALECFVMYVTGG
ncbi:MAG TPA: hypothetical protein VNI36_13050, partial [Candidatus Dormibacteraeota bacterium]|nr:hypothetical protein [Candidatus Dormibacteraeota bacterium]